MCLHKLHYFADAVSRITTIVASGFRSSTIAIHSSRTNPSSPPVMNQGQQDIRKDKIFASARHHFCKLNSSGTPGHLKEYDLFVLQRRASITITANQAQQTPHLKAARKSLLTRYSRSLKICCLRTLPVQLALLYHVIYAIDSTIHNELHPSLLSTLLSSHSSNGASNIPLPHICAATVHSRESPIENFSQNAHRARFRFFSLLVPILRCFL